MNCGARLYAGETASQKSTDRSSQGLLGQYLPPELLAKLEAARAHGGMAGERRVITMLFCDVRGSTAAAEQVDPEVWSDIMNGAFERMITPIYRYEGTVPRLMGDAILAFFGAPIAHEDDPQRAVWAGLEIQAAIKPYAEGVHRSHGVEFGVRVGINTGLVVVGEMGSDMRLEYTALGDAVNVAARMEQAALPGTVQIAEETYKLIAPLFDFEPLGGVEVKGKAKSVSAYRVLGRNAQPGSLRGLKGLTSPLVGREAEVELLDQMLTALPRGTGAFVAVSGEAGVGKSSLVAEVQRRTGARNQAETDMLWLRGDATAYARSVSYFPWRQIIRESIEARADEPAASIREKLGATCEHAGLGAEDAAFLEAVLALESDKSRSILARYEGEALFDGIVASMRGYLAWLASGRPLVLTFDDLHWADEASLGLLQAVAILVSVQPITFLCMLRPEMDSPAWKTVQKAAAEMGERFSAIPLPPLSRDQTNALLHNLLGAGAFPDRFQALIAEKSGGNPFFVEELIRSLIEAKQIIREKERWRAASDGASLALPDTLRGLLSARIDRLPEAGRHVLQMASVIGRTFDPRVLERLAAVPDLPAEIERLREAGLLEGATSRQQEEMAFRHVLIQEAAYDSILIRKRADLHRQVAEVLEALHEGSIEEYAPLLAHHFYAAQDDRSLLYDLLAGDVSARLYANVDAAAHYRRALQTAQRFEAPPQQIGAIFSKLGGVLELVGQHKEALETYERMEEFAHRSGIPSIELAALTARATLYSTPTSVRDQDLSEKTMIRALEVSAAVADTQIQAKLTWTMMLNYLHSRRIASAYEYGRRALELARQADDPERLAFVLNDFGRVLVCRGDFEEALALIREGRGLWRELNNRVMLADNLGAEEEALYSVGRFDDLLPVGRQALEISEELGNAWGKSYHRLLMGLAQFERGERKAAIELMSQAVELGDEGGLIISSIAGRCDLAWCYGVSGEVDKGLEALELAMEAARSHLPDWIVMPTAMQVRLHGLRGERLEAEAAAEGVALDPPTLAYPHYTMMVGLARVELARLRGDHEQMLALAEEILRDLQHVLPAEAPKLLAYKAEALRGLGREVESRTETSG